MAGLVTKVVSGAREKAGYMVSTTLESDRALTVVTKTRQMVQNLVAGLLITSLVLALAVFLYATFYRSYMPVELLEKDLDLQFQPCDKKPTMCSFPHASLVVDPKKKYMMLGQPYSVSLLLEMPDSPDNQGLGMFMSCLSVNSSLGVSQKSCRSSILEYRSQMLRMIETVVICPFLLTGLTTQRQWVRVNYFTEFLDDPTSPATELILEIQSKFIQVYSAKMEIHAQLTGLRHLMYHHPWISSFIGIFANILTLCTLILLSWSNLLRPDIVTLNKTTSSEPETEEDVLMIDTLEEKATKVETVGWK